MLVAGTGAGLLNGETATVMQSATPQQRAGMASGLCATARFTRLLVGAAGLGSVLSSIAERGFMAAAVKLGLAQDLSDNVAQRVTSGDLVGAVAQAPQNVRRGLQRIGVGAFAQGFSAASLTAASVALISAILTFALVRSSDTAAHANATIAQGVGVQSNPLQSSACRS